MATALTRAPASSPPAPAPARAAVPEVEPRARRLGPVTVGAATAAVAAGMLFGALLAAFLLLRGATRVWPPKGVQIDNYRGTTVMITMLLVSATVQWAVHAARSDDHSHTIVGLAMAMGLGAAAADLTWFTMVKAGFGAGTTYGMVWFALLGSFLAVALAGLAVLVVAVVRVAAGQLSADNHQAVTAAAIHWHLLTVAWAGVYLTVWRLR